MDMQDMRSEGKPAAFTGSYADFKLIKTRGVVSISFEVPVEQAQLALDVLGGMPVAAAEVHCAIARLQEAKPEVQKPVQSDAIAQAGRPSMAAKAEGAGQGARLQTPAAGESPAQSKTAFRDMRMPNQAGILCDTKSFRKFLSERQDYSGDVNTAETAAHLVRLHCGVKSRSDIRPRTPSGDRWQKLVDEYRAWMHEPEYA